MTFNLLKPYASKSLKIAIKTLQKHPIQTKKNHISQDHSGRVHEVFILPGSTKSLVIYQPILEYDTLFDAIWEIL
jgi:hypothetical protein